MKNTYQPIGRQRRPMVSTFVLLVVAPIASTACRSGTTPPDAKVWMGERVFRVLSEPESVVVYTVEPRIPEEGSAEPRPALHGYPIVREAGRHDAAVAWRFSEVLLSPESYDFSDAKKCIFEPGVGLRFVRGAEEAVALLCFHCDEWAVDAEDTEDFDAARPALVRLVKEVLPDDAGVQGLSESRP